MNTKTKGIFKTIGTIALAVIPLGTVIAAVYYAPEIKQWYMARKEKKVTNKKNKEV